MKYRAEEIEKRLRAGQDSGFQFKPVEFAGDRPERPARNDWADEIAAFANAAGGLVLAGIADDGVLVGMSRAQITSLAALLVEVSTDTIKPPVLIRTRNLELSGGRLVLLLEVPESDFVHDSPGGCYVRVGSTKRLMGADEKLRLARWRSRGLVSRFDEKPVQETGFGTLSENLWKRMLSLDDAAEPEGGLAKLALLHRDSMGVIRATVAGVLLCTPNPESWFPNASITAVRYRGGDRATGQIDAREITGPLTEQIDGAVAFAVRNMQIAARKDPARLDLPQYSEKALFEAVVNAVVHRDYSVRGSRIRLSMFNDRLEIQSPGSLPNDLTVESMAFRQSVRNKILASVLSRMPVGEIHGTRDRRFFMDRRGDGVPAIMRETRALCGKYPAYRVIDDSDVLLTIPAAFQEPSPARVVVSVLSGGRPLPCADLLLLFPNNTWVRAATGGEGEAAMELHTTHLPMTVFAAATGYAAHLERDWIPAERALVIDLDVLPEGGSVIFPEGAGRCPGLRGSLKPVRDEFDRICLYAADIAINGGERQPVHYVLGEDLKLTDDEGSELQVRVVEVTGRSALVECFDFRPGHR